MEDNSPFFLLKSKLLVKGMELETENAIFWQGMNDDEGLFFFLCFGLVGSPLEDC